jgi:hypothetical protein
LASVGAEEDVAIIDVEEVIIRLEIEAVLLGNEDAD